MFGLKVSDNFKGLTAAVVIIILWTANLVFFFRQDFVQLPVVMIGWGMVVQTFLFTGLFITAHDAMHGTVFPKNRKFNDFIGILATKLYAFFSYKHLLTEHWKHHRHPASSLDPDFHDGRHRGMIPWYFRFMAHYLTWKQMLGMAIAFNFFLYVVHVPVSNLVIFWIVPAFLSTFQLFIFGTYLPHREQKEGYRDEHRARSNNFPVFWSFLSCYHFGYHWEHHEYPHISWWRLPQIRKTVLATGKIA